MKKRSFEKWLHERVSESVWAVNTIGSEKDYANLAIYRSIECITKQEDQIEDVLVWVKANIEQLADKIEQPKSLRIYEYQQSALEKVYIQLCALV